MELIKERLPPPWDGFTQPGKPLKEARNDQTGRVFQLALGSKCSSEIGSYNSR